MFVGGGVGRIDTPLQCASKSTRIRAVHHFPMNIGHPVDLDLPVHKRLPTHLRTAEIVLQPPGVMVLLTCSK